MEYKSKLEFPNQNEDLGVAQSRIGPRLCEIEVLTSGGNFRILKTDLKLLVHNKPPKFQEKNFLHMPGSWKLFHKCRSWSLY